MFLRAKKSEKLTRKIASRVRRIRQKKKHQSFHTLIELQDRHKRWSNLGVKPFQNVQRGFIRFRIILLRVPIYSKPKDDKLNDNENRGLQKENHYSIKV